jgi:histidine triad (HIT) family protein
MADCIFCQLIAGRLPASKVYEDDQVLAFMDAGQVNPGHVIVAVKPHVATIYDLSPELAAAVFTAAVKIARALKASMRAEGLTLLQANEKAGGQTVAHFHIHVLPRHFDDGVAFTWPVKHPPREELERLAARVRHGLT